MFGHPLFALAHYHSSIHFFSRIVNTVLLLNFSFMFFRWSVFSKKKKFLHSSIFSTTAHRYWFSFDTLVHLELYISTRADHRYSFASVPFAVVGVVLVLNCRWFLTVACNTVEDDVNDNAIDLLWHLLRWQMWFFDDDTNYEMWMLTMFLCFTVRFLIELSLCLGWWKGSCTKR